MFRCVGGGRYGNGQVSAQDAAAERAETADNGADLANAQKRDNQEDDAASAPAVDVLVLWARQAGEDDIAHDAAEGGDEDGQVDAAPLAGAQVAKQGGAQEGDELRHAAQDGG